MTTAQDQMKRLKRELHLTKERYDDLIMELHENQEQLIKVEDVDFSITIVDLFDRKEIVIEMR